MIILGIDPGSRIAGYGLVQKKGEILKHLDNGGIYCGKEENFPLRLKMLFEETQKLIKQFSPQALSIENIFYSKNVQSALKLGHARGAILAAATTMELPVYEYTPLAIKQAITGYGRAPKEQVQQMVKILLNLPQIAEENASDALAAAICHVNTFRVPS